MSPSAPQRPSEQSVRTWLRNRGRDPHNAAERHAARAELAAAERDRLRRLAALPQVTNQATRRGR